MVALDNRHVNTSDSADARNRGLTLHYKNKQQQHTTMTTDNPNDHHQITDQNNGVVTAACLTEPTRPWAACQHRRLDGRVTRRRLSHGVRHVEARCAGTEAELCTRVDTSPVTRIARVRLWPHSLQVTVDVDAQWSVGDGVEQSLADRPSPRREGRVELDVSGLRGVPVISALVEVEVGERVLSTVCARDGAHPLACGVVPPLEGDGGVDVARRSEE